MATNHVMTRRQMFLASGVTGLALVGFRGVIAQAHPQTQLPKPRWITTAELAGITAYPSNVGWVLDLNSTPQASATYLANLIEVNVFNDLFAPNDYEILQLAQQFQDELAQEGVVLSPMLQRQD